MLHFPIKKVITKLNLMNKTWPGLSIIQKKVLIKRLYEQVICNAKVFTLSLMITWVGGEKSDLTWCKKFCVVDFDEYLFLSWRKVLTFIKQVFEFYVFDQHFIMTVKSFDLKKMIQVLCLQKAFDCLGKSFDFGEKLCTLNWLWKVRCCMVQKKICRRLWPTLLHDGEKFWLR